MNPGGLEPSVGHPTLARRLFAGLLLLLELPVLIGLVIGALAGAVAYASVRVWRLVRREGA
jgi:hypothetical protein